MTPKLNKNKPIRIVRLILTLILFLVSGVGIVSRLTLPPDPTDYNYYVLFTIVFLFSVILFGHLMWEEDLITGISEAGLRPKSEDSDEFVYIASHQLRSFPATIRWYL